MTTPPTLRIDTGVARIDAGAYSVSLAMTPGELSRAPYLELFGSDQRMWTRLCLLSSIDQVGGRDETWEVSDVAVRHVATGVEIAVSTRSAVWKRRRLVVGCTWRGLEITAQAEGQGQVTDVTLCGGAGRVASGASGTFRSAIHASSLFVPTPTEPVHFVRAADSPAVLGVVGDADPGRVHGIFSPPPLAFGLSRSAPGSGTDLSSAGEWLGLCARAPVDMLNFTTMRYEPLDGGFLIRLTYEGSTTVEGSWCSPTLVLRFASSALGVIDEHRDDLVREGLAPSPGARPAPPSWWLQPLFCGWGAQCASAETESPPALCRQSVYDGYLAGLAERGLDPGTIVIDDRWEATYGTGIPDLEHWPDLRGWIRSRHAEGRKVLLWWKTWDPSGIPLDEAVLDAGSRAVAVDPANPRYLQRLGRIVAAMIDPAGLDADGLKVDFTQRTPSGHRLRRHPGVWGIAALHALLRTIYIAAKRAKPDALVVCHAVHPSFADVCDMVRTNDLLQRDPAGRRVAVAEQLATRHAIVTHALPGVPVDTDQWPMPDRAQWLDYARLQATLGVPALYYVDRVGEPPEAIAPEHAAVVARTWADYRKRLLRDR